MKSMTTLWGSVGCALLLAACGGGGGASGGPGVQDVSAGAHLQQPAGNPGTSAPDPTASTGAPAAQQPEQAPPSPGTAPAQRPDVMVASMDEIAAWNAACTTPDCRIDLPARSGRSLNWWGADPRQMEQVNESCGPQPDCRVPDGDLLVWNFSCSPQPTCRIQLSRAY